MRAAHAARRDRPRRRAGRSRSTGSTTTTSPAAAARTCWPRRSTSGLTDDDAPGVLVLETGGSTGVTEPTNFVVLGDGFVTEVLTNHTFKGDFGTAILGEAVGQQLAPVRAGPRARQVEPQHAPELRRPGPGAGRDPDAGRGAPDRARDRQRQLRLVPLQGHARRCSTTAGGNGVQAAFDIDRGFAFGDPIIWLSLLRVYNAQGDLLAQGNGFSDPLDPQQRPRQHDLARRLPDVHVHRARATTTSRSPRGCSRAPRRTASTTS